MLKKLPRSLVTYVTALGIEYVLFFVSEKSPAPYNFSDMNKTSIHCSPDNTRK